MKSVVVGVIEVKQWAPDGEGGILPFLAEAPSFGLKLTDPYLIGLLLEESYPDRVEEMKQLKLPERFFGKAPCGELVVVMTRGVVDDVELAERVWRTAASERLSME